MMGSMSWGAEPLSESNRYLTSWKLIRRELLQAEEIILCACNRTGRRAYNMEKAVRPGLVLPGRNIPGQRRAWAA